MIGGITRDSVLAAIGECDRAGRRAFTSWHGYSQSAAYEVAFKGRRYDSKAIVGVAFGYEHDCEPLGPSEFSGGVEHAARVLVRLGFDVRRGHERLTDDDVALPHRLAMRSTSAELRLYVCRPTNRRSVAACHEHGFGTLLSPLTADRNTGGLTDISAHACTAPIDGLPYVLDNGAWACHAAGRPWAEDPFARLLGRVDAFGRQPEFAVLPDLVGGGRRSLEFSLDWLERRSGSALAQASPAWMLAVQDGMVVDDVRQALLDYGLAGIFVGGSAGRGTPNWKWKSVHEWAALGHELGLRVHVGRVNGERRAELCRDLGCTSIDGSSVTRFAKNAAKMARPCDGDDRPMAERGPDARRVAQHAAAERRFRLTLGAPA